MATDPTAPAKDPAEGSSETIDRELERAENPRKSLSPRRPTPGDEAVTGTPGTGEDICPDCRGSGKLGAEPCPNCNGSGRIIRGIGGA